MYASLMHNNHVSVYGEKVIIASLFVLFAYEYNLVEKHKSGGGQNYRSKKVVLLNSGQYLSGVVKHESKIISLKIVMQHVEL